VIPSYNNWIYLQNVLKHILAQDFPRENIETIIVDDGSNDSTRTGIREFFRNIRGEANVSYIYFPRSKPRVMGDDQFRAGVARNLGVKQAKGRILLFLDSDIL
jgi:glycosyltransferase involved in cell wall biosynthesis